MHLGRFAEGSAPGWPNLEGARLLADHEGVKTKLTLRTADARTLVLKGEAAWSAVQRLIRAGAMDALKPTESEDGSSASLRIEARGNDIVWIRSASFEPKTSAAEVINAEVVAQRAYQRRR